MSEQNLEKKVTITIPESYFSVKEVKSWIYNLQKCDELVQTLIVHFPKRCLNIVCRESEIPECSRFLQLFKRLGLHVSEAKRSHYDDTVTYIVTNFESE